MESTQRDIMSVLLRRLFDLGLLSRSTYSQAVDLVHSAIDLPDCFGYPVCPPKEAKLDAGTQNSR